VFAGKKVEAQQWVKRERLDGVKVVDLTKSCKERGSLHSFLDAAIRESGGVP